MEYSEDREMMISVIRWFARVLGVIFAGFFLFMAIGESLQSQSPIKPLAAIWLGLVGTWAIAMLPALIPRCEHPAVLVGVAALLGAHVEGLFLGLFEYPGHLTLESVVNPLLLFLWVPVLLYLLSWWFERRTLRPRAEASLPDKA